MSSEETELAASDNEPLEHSPEDPELEEAVRATNALWEVELEFRRHRRLFRKYGISLEKYKEMYDLQCGRCAACKNFFDQLDVDHCHTLGQVRGLLCRGCNLTLGRYRDDPDRLEESAQRLEASARRRRGLAVYVRERAPIWPIPRWLRRGRSL